MNALRNIGRLFSPGEPVRQRVDLFLDQGRVVSVVPVGGAGGADEEFDCAGGLLTPGLIDAHTHPVYARARLEEVSVRSEGTSYAQVSASGGGINATVRDTRAASFAALEGASQDRLLAGARGGAGGGRSAAAAGPGQLPASGDRHLPRSS